VGDGKRGFVGGIGVTGGGGFWRGFMSVWSVLGKEAAGKGRGAVGVWDDDRGIGGIYGHRNA
jgi:hypothetical protein